MFHPTRHLRRVVALAGSALLVTAALATVAVQPASAAATVAAKPAATAKPAAATKPAAVTKRATAAKATAGAKVTAAATATGGSGASLPYVEVLAQSSPTNGTIIGPSYTQGQLADEAVGREAVTLTGTGEYVTFTTPIATNSIDIRYSIPDSSDGSTYTAPLSLYINGTATTPFTLTNEYSWQYGGYPFTNTPGSDPEHFFDEVHRLFSTTYPAGTTFKLQVDSGDTASSYTINLADFENVAAPLAQPAGSVSVVSEGADPTGSADSTAAFNAAITAAGAGGTVWIPAGTYDIPGHITVNDVTVEGAGMWYSTITGAEPGFFGLGTPTSCGVVNNPAGVSTNVHLSNFAIFGQVNSRVDCDQDNGIGGAMSNSTVSNIWIEHMKVGAWMDGPMTNLTFSGMRIRDTFADGINLHGGVTDATITDSEIRNTGDDGIALWSDSTLGADSGVTISDNTVQQEQLANGIAVYGGNNNTVTGNLVEDAGINQGGGITVAQRFTSTPLGLTTVTNNTMIRDGQLDPNWEFGVGALWFDADQTWGGGPVNVSNELIEQSPFEAIQWVEGTITGVNLSNISIIGTGTFALQEQTGGSSTVTNVTATGVAQATAGNAPSYSCEGTSFTLTDDGGNSGISPTQCVTDDPTPVYPPYPASTVTAAPSALSFGSQAEGTTSSAQTVTVSNPTSSAASVSSISASGEFAETNTCGSSIAANGSCTVSVTFTPTAAGTQTGSLTINAGGVTDTVSLTGSGTAPGPVLNASPGGLSFAATDVGSTSATQAVTVTNSGTTAATVSGVSVTGAFSQTNNCSSIAVNASCTVTVSFKPTTSGTNTGTLTVTSNANNSPTTVSLTGSGIGSTTNIALNQPITASSDASGYPATNANDGNTSTYWESLDGAAYPQTLTVNLGSVQSIGSVTLDLPPATDWSTRTETLSVLGSTNGSSFSQIVGSAGYTFNPSTGNTVTISLPSGTSTQYVELSFTANTGWSAAQISEFEVFPGGGGGSTGPTGALTASPTSLSFGNEATGQDSTAQTVTVTNPNSSAVSLSAISISGAFAQTNTCPSSLPGGGSCTVSVQFEPTATGASSGTLSVPSSAPGSPLTVALTGTGTSTSTNLALNAAVTASSYTQTYVPANAVDGNTSTYWEADNGVWPSTITVNLGSSQTLGSVTITLPPSSAWNTRTQTLSILGSTNDSTFSTIVGSATYTWNPSTGNTVTIPLPSGTSDQYVEFSFTANSVQNGAQASEIEIYG
ncbi:MAG TPA: choice-of-anchor D domain-containing protein [Streptosporangiaceae bacterium]|nr:choice-of-anchor D domain-containing protein [Streptosporangiaceae bacterium]